MSEQVNSPVRELAQQIEMASSSEERRNLINHFYVPNTKEDIYDFFLLAVSKLEDDGHDNEDAWQQKLEQTYYKARIVLGDTPEFAYLEKLYKKAGKTKQVASSDPLPEKIKKFSRNGISFFTRIIQACLIVVGLTFILFGIILDFPLLIGVGFVPFLILFVFGVLIRNEHKTTDKD